MLTSLNFNHQSYRCDLSKPIDISIPIGSVKCFYAPDFKKKPVEAGAFIGAVEAGAPVNFFDLSLNPHGNGTHTECLGHITIDQESINDCLQQFHFVGRLISVTTDMINGDHVIQKEMLKKACAEEWPEALIIRSLPNNTSKLSMDYSGKNPAYLSHEAMEYIIEKKVKHLLIDLPSVDKEDDGGKVANHKLFWNILTKMADKSARFENTITELIYVPMEVPDGLYLINLQIPSIHNDAVPSKPVLYQLNKV